MEGWNPLKHFTIAIDGPGGAGKSTVAGNVAKRLSVLHLDTGAMYRAFALAALAAGVPRDDTAAAEALANRLRIDVRFEDGAQHTFVDGEDVTLRIRTPEMSRAASDYAVLPPVRRHMVALQQQIATRQSMVLDGRDIGTRVLPNATLKVFLTASAQVRAQRRLAELLARGVQADLDTVLREVNERDHQDSTRAVDPLAVANDAVTLDTSAMTQPEVEDAIIALLEAKLMEGQQNAAQGKPREPFTFFYKVAMAVSHLLFTVLTPVVYHGLEHIDQDAPYILIGNHNSMVDPLLIGWKAKRYQLRFLGKIELTRNPLMNAIYKNMLMIPVDRHNMDMKAVRACLKTLAEGHVLAIFPEGTRYKKTLMEEMESGVGMIALRSGAPILPAYIAGKPRLFRRLHCYYGAPFSLAEHAKGGVNREAIDAALADIAARYRQMEREHLAAVAR